MNSKTKKKIFTLALVIALLAIVMIGGSLAWFTSEDSADNVFTVGSVKIEQIEQQWTDDAHTGLENFKDDKVLLPIVNTENPEKDPNYQDKIVTVKSIGSNGAYVRTHIAVPTALVGYIDLDLEENTSWNFAYSNPTTVDGTPYTVYTYLYAKELNADTPTTDVLLNGVYLYAYVDVQDNPDTPETDLVFCKRNHPSGEIYHYSSFVVLPENGTANNRVNVLVATQAVQSEGFTDAKSALDSAFGQNAIPVFKLDK